ncbi:ABC transporter permease [Arthrobacter sp. 9AX]|uniref:ABC transporter permease n=1 Tax=Arthrobacter sp. 9AX TaxID=2653131 RepID=UPI00135A669F|nr:ABC transporter permease subunit [Arthrobacter sp. 9AX]
MITVADPGAQTAQAPPTGDQGKFAPAKARGPVLVVSGLLAAWMLLAVVFDGRHIVPYPWTLLEQFVADRSLLLSNAAYTLDTAVKGFGLGVAAVIPLAVLCLLFPVSEPIIMRLAVVVHVIPFVAIAPIIVVALPGDMARIVIAALEVYFPLMIGLLLGLRTTDERALDVVCASGGRGWAQLRFVRLASSIPSLVSGLQIAVPAAVLGALISEFFGADRGLGAILVNAQDSLMMARTWCIAVFIGAIAAAGYGLIRGLSQLIVPWAGQGTDVSAAVAGTETAKVGRAGTLMAGAASLILILGFWQGLRSVFGFDEYFVKTPGEVLNFLIVGNPVTGEGPGMFFGEFMVGLGQTIVDATAGFLVGMLAAIAASVLFVAVPSLATVLMPMAIMLRSVPLVALTPLLVLIFGRGLLGVTLLVTLVTFFPTLVTVALGLRSTPEAAIDVVRATGGTKLQAALHVRLMYAIPSISSAARIAVPAAVSGATLAEWLATGKGLGSVITMASANAEYLALWSSGALLVIFVLALYTLIGLIDKGVSRRLGIAL